MSSESSPRLYLAVKLIFFLKMVYHFLWVNLRRILNAYTYYARLFQILETWTSCVVVVDGKISPRGSLSKFDLLLEHILKSFILSHRRATKPRPNPLYVTCSGSDRALVHVDWRGADTKTMQSITEMITSPTLQNIYMYELLLSINILITGGCFKLFNCALDVDQFTRAARRRPRINCRPYLAISIISTNN